MNATRDLVDESEWETEQDTEEGEVDESTTYRVLSESDDRFSSDDDLDEQLIESNKSKADEEERLISPYDFLLPYDTNEEDDDDDFSVPDTEFLECGWDGECLQDLEDIDFEFVYALHTFVATVEGQANATKGDTMVLLDDSNSYWWLVRVVKDSSIGEWH